MVAFVIYFSAGQHVVARAASEGSEGTTGEKHGTNPRPSLVTIMASEGLESSLLCLRWLETATAADCAAAASGLTKGRKDHEWSDHRRWIFYTRWAELDPKAALAFCQTQENVDVEIILAVWGRTNFSDAWTAAVVLPEDERAEACLAVLKGLAMVDPRRAWSEALAHENILGADWDKTDMLLSLAKTDPARAAALASSLTNTEDADTKRLFGIWGTRDLPAAWAYANSLSAENGRDTACQGVLERLIKHDLTAARNLLATFPADAMADWKGVLAETFTYQDPVGARAWAESLAPGPGRRRALAGVAMVLARSGQPEDALPVFASMNWQIDPPPSIDRQVITEDGSSFSSATAMGDGELDRDVTNALVTTLGAWGQRDPAAALKQCSEILATAKNGGMWAGSKIGLEWAQHDPAAALAAVTALPKDSVGFRDDLVRTVMNEWMSQDISAAKAAVEALPVGDIRTEVAESVIQRLLGRDPSAAFHWAAQQDTTAFHNVLKQQPYLALTAFDATQLPAELRHELAVGLGHQVWDDEPARTLHILLKENITDDGFERTLNSYLRRDPKAASAWVKALPNGEAKEVSISTLAEHLRAQDEPDFEASFLWAQTMQASERRDATLVDTLRSWEKLTPGAAQRALEASKLAPPERFRLMEKLKKPQVFLNDPFAP